MKMAKKPKFVFGTYFAFVLLVSFDVGGATGCTKGCSDGLGLNYTLPMFNECKEKKHPNGSMVQTIPKLIPYSSREASCPTTRKSKLGIPPGHRECRFPACGSNPCKNGWCEETMEGYECHCSTGFDGRRCTKESTTTSHATTMSTSTSKTTSESPTSTSNSAIESNTTSDAMTMSTSTSKTTSESPTSTSNSTIESNTTSDAMTMSTSTSKTTSESPTSTSNSTIESNTTSDAMTMSTSTSKTTSESPTSTSNSTVVPGSPRDCSEIQAGGVNISGVYPIYLEGANDALDVYCDMKTDGGGWTVFQRRQDGSVDFWLEWDQYKHGFGNVSGEHWLGNDNIHRLSTQKTYELRVDLEDFERETRYACYSSFKIENEAKKYKLKIGSYSGNAGNSLEYHKDRLFSTKDRDNDNDLRPNGHCAVRHTGAWWYHYCHESNLNGQYLNGTTEDPGVGVTWKTWHGLFYSLKKADMKIRPA